MTQPDDQQTLLNNHTRRLQKLREKTARAGKNALPEDLLEIEDLQVKVADLRRHLGLPAVPQDRAALEARARYLTALQDRYGVIQPNAFQALAKDSRVGQVRRLTLLGKDGVYVPLTFDPQSRQPEWPETPRSERELARLAKKEQEPLTLPAVLKGPGHLVLIGDAGCGKTTLLQVIATALAVAAEPEDWLGDLRPVIPAPAPLPIFLPLRFFDYACTQGKYDRTAADLLRFMDNWFAGWVAGVSLPAGFLADHFLAGQAWLLLDALDEVADPDHRKTIRNVIETLAARANGSRLIVTARVAGYRGAELTGRFTVNRVRDLDEDQRRAMIAVVYRGLDLPDKDNRARQLAERFEGDILRDLGRTPVMVWAATVIDAVRGTLPETRAALYEEYVDMLLRHSFKEHEADTAPLEAIRNSSAWSVEDRCDYLSYIAFAIHHQLDQQPERRQKSRAQTVDEGDLVDGILVPYFMARGLVEITQNRPCPPPEARRQAQKLARHFITVMVEHSGLLYESTPGNYSVGDHLTMQEFLAGRYLVNYFNDDDPEGYRDFLAKNTGNSWWREVFILATGYLAETRPSTAQRFLQKLAAQGDAPPEKLAALNLSARALLPLRRRRQRPSWYNTEAGQLAGRLYSALYAAPVEAPLPLRQEAALALGHLHGYPGDEGVPDPRFAEALGLPKFIKIEAGRFWMGEDDSEKNEKPRHRVYLDAYELARYPTTNAMFARFVGAGGYREARWWAEAIAAQRWQNGRVEDFTGERSQPAYWEDARFNNPHQPVVGVTWFEAVAYCRWLTAELNDGYTYHLPTEAQWEKAARGEAENRYPWGNDWAEGRANSKETGLETTSPPGLFAAGATAAGLHDLAGNVWEWCADYYGKDYYARSPEQNPAGPEQGNGWVMRGGSWYNPGASRCRCGYRYGNNYDVYWSDDNGFRCARTLS